MVMRMSKHSKVLVLALAGGCFSGCLPTSSSFAIVVTRLGDCGCSQYDDGIFQPAWSPDGNHLAFVNSSAYPPGYEFWQAILVADLRGGPLGICTAIQGAWN